MGGTVLHIGAHPDDEDIGLMAYMARKFGVRIIYWSATRGEGGQNRIGPYKGEALGIYRTWETLDVRALDGGESLFGPFYDFGFCKTGEEALTKWGRTKLVRELVGVIRWTQPQIVVGRWTGGPGDGHGHHQAVGEATIEAFEAAGDPNEFPQQFDEGLAIWQPRKLYHSTSKDWQPGQGGTFGEIQPELEQDGLLRINTGEFDPIARHTYQEVAWTAFNKHQTQAMGFIPNRGDFFYYYSLYKSLVSIPDRETSFFDGLDPSLTGLADYPGGQSEGIRASLERIKRCAEDGYVLFRGDDTVEAAAAVLEGLAHLHQLRATIQNEDLEPWVARSLNTFLKRKTIDFERVAAQCLGIQLECLTNRAHVTPGQPLHITSRIWNHGQAEIDATSFVLQMPDGWKSRLVAETTSDSGPLHTTLVDEIIVPKKAELTGPYWLNEPRQMYSYSWPTGEPSGQPFGPALVEMECEVTIGQHRLRLREPAVLRESFSGGFRELPLVVIPPISLHPKAGRRFIQMGSGRQNLELQVVARSNEESGQVEGTLSLDAPSGWMVEPNHIHLSLSKAGDTESLRLRITIPDNTPAGDYELEYVVRTGGRNYGFVLNPVWMGAPGLPRLPDAVTCIREEFVITPATITVHMIDAKFVPGLSYAYIKGLDEDLLDTLMSFSLNFDILRDDEIGYTDLSRFDAIIIGPNAYLMRDELAKNASRLLDYVAQGGTLIVQYQGYGYQDRGFTPYPFKYHQPHDRVTYENAPVTILNPRHTLFNRPNVITQADFEGWGHDRGLYFFGEWDRQYEPLLSSHDPNELPRDGGMLVASYGRGTYLYTGYSLFRQVPAGVKGAFRIVANLLALPAARILERVEFLKQAPLFSFMAEEQLQGVARIMTERWEEDGVYLCHQGDEGNELYIIVQGEVEIINETDGKIFLVEKVGGCIGELAVLESIPRAAAMRTKGEVRLLVLQADHFQALIHEHPNMSYRVIQMLVRKLAGIPATDSAR